MTVEGEKVKVITAGGAPGGKKKKKGKKHKKSPTVEANPTEPTTATANDDMATAAGPVTGLQNAASPATNSQFTLEFEQSERGNDDPHLGGDGGHNRHDHDDLASPSKHSIMDQTVEPVKIETLIRDPPPNNSKRTELVWLFLCFIGIMASFVVYGVLLEYTTSGGRKLHELSFLFVTSGLYTLTAAAGRYVRAETPTTIPPARFAILGLTSMGSTFCSVRSLR